MKAMDVLGVRVEMPLQAPMLLLKEVGGPRFLPIWIGATEASAIANAMDGVVPQRPLTHDLLVAMLDELGHHVEQVHINELSEGVFFATLLIGEHEISARPSDAIAIAVRSGAEIWCDDAVLDEAGVELPVADDDEVEKFREFLDQVDPDDFGLSNP